MEQLGPLQRSLDSEHSVLPGHGVNCNRANVIVEQLGPQQKSFDSEASGLLGQEVNGNSGAA